MADMFENASETLKPVTKAVHSGSSGSSYMYFAIILVVIVLITIGVIWYLLKISDMSVVLGPFVLGGNNGSTPEKIFTQSQIERSLGNNFTLSFFLYMDKVNKERIPFAGPDGEYRGKPIVYIRGVGDITVDPIHQKMRLNIRPLVQNGGRFQEGGVVSLDTANFMIARWNQVTFSIEGRTVDLYVNGNLTKSMLLENLPILNPIGVTLETSPDFLGQAGYFQAWPRRLHQDEIIKNYKRVTDTRGKPLIPDKGPDMFKNLGKSLCDMGICGVRISAGPLHYVDYDFA